MWMYDSTVSPYLNFRKFENKGPLSGSNGSGTEVMYESPTVLLDYHES
jgi:hypothetical protein